MIKRNYFGLLLILAIFAFSSKLNAQSQQLTIYPDKDAMVKSYMSNRNTNYGTYTLFDASAWTLYGGYYKERSFMQFDVSAIPSNAVIDNATLYLYASGHAQNNEDGNKCFIKMLTSYWDEEYVTWNNQPGTSLDSLQKLAINDSIINVPSSTSNTQNYTIDIKKFIEYWVKGKIENLGLVLMLQNENIAYNKLCFYSSDYLNTSLRPKVVISYHVENAQDPTFTQNKNWVRTISYLENGEVASDDIVFADFLGKTTQVQQQLKNPDNTKYLIVNQLIYDASGRPVLSTLPAATNSVFGTYITNFITPGDNITKEYDYNDFNTFNTEFGTNPGDVNNPKMVSSSSVLGNYYSNNNTMENYVGTTSFPYNTVYYGLHQKEKINKVSSAGDMLRMGTGKEKSSYKVYASPQELVVGAGASAEFPVPAYKIINTDENNNVTVAYYNADNQLIATCETDPSLLPYDVTGVVLMPGFVDLHIPNDSYYQGHYNIDCINLSGPAPDVNWFNIESDGSYIIPVAFENSVGKIDVDLLATGAEYIRINAINNSNNSEYRMVINYKLNYTNFKLYENDKAGNLIKNYAAGSDYYYNSLGMLTKESNRDRGTTNYYYYDDGRLHFKINANQSTNYSLSFIAYDEVGRPVRTGEHVFANENYVNEYIINPEANSDLISISRDVCDTWYDLPDKDFYTVTGLSSKDYIQTNLWGRVSKTSNDNATTWYSYDMQGRLLWMVQKINGLGVKTMDYVYNWKGLLEKTLYQKNTKAESFDHIFIYDENLRLHEVKTFTYNSTSSIYKSAARYLYYKHGPLKRIEIANNLQGMDYIYTVNGWLKSINSPDLTSADPGGDAFAQHPGFKQDIFGETLDYFNGDYTRNNTNIFPINTTNDYFNGNVKAMRWKTANNTIRDNNTTVFGDNLNQIIYKFTYDKHNWLTDADFGKGVVNGNVVSFVQPLNNKTFDMDISYDNEGNIQTLNRYAYLNNGNVEMDKLVYNYDGNIIAPKPNRLLSVDDNSANISYTTDIKDQLPNNYSYNSNGELIGDVKSSLYYTYNHIGLVTNVYNDSSHDSLKASYLYDERGHRLKKTVYNGTSTTVTWYINDASGTVLCIQTIPNQAETGSEYPIYGLNRIGTYNNSTNQFTYDITDHLGNVRAVIKKSTSGALEFVSATDYYPWGMEMPGRMYNSTSNRYGYQGEYSEKDAETNLNTFDLRQFDSRLGRWLNPDPMFQYNNPYIGMGNNPISFVDPTGGSDWPGPDQRARYAWDYTYSWDTDLRPTCDRASAEYDDPGWKVWEYGDDGGGNNGANMNSNGLSIGASGGSLGGLGNTKYDPFFEERDRLAHLKAEQEMQTKYKNMITWFRKPHSNFGSPGDDPTIPKTRKERQAYLENFYNAYFRDKIDPKLKENITKIKYVNQNTPDYAWGSHDKRWFHKGYILRVYKYTFDYGSNYEIYYTVGHELIEIAYEMENFKINLKTNYRHNAAMIWESKVDSPEGKTFIELLENNNKDVYDESDDYYKQIQKKYNIPLVIPHFE